MDKKHCKNCSKEFKKPYYSSKKVWQLRIYCSIICAAKANVNPERLKGIKRPPHVLEKMKLTMFKKGQVSVNKGRKFPQFTEEKATAWKGDKVGYSGLHMWVRKILGTPDTCEHCNKTGLKGKSIHWANKSHEYKRDLTDWLRLCASCHLIYDRG